MVSGRHTCITVSVSITAIVLILSGCVWRRPYHRTPLAALTEFPGFLSEQNLGSVSVLREEAVAGGFVLLHSFASNQSGRGPQEYCVATTFVTRERSGSWRSQSASGIGCYASIPQTFEAMFTVGGNGAGAGLTTVYGFGPADHQVRIRWSDGFVGVVPIEENIFLKSRPETLQVNHVELLDRNNTVVDSITLFK